MIGALGAYVISQATSASDVLSVAGMLPRHSTARVGSFSRAVLLRDNSGSHLFTSSIAILLHTVVLQREFGMGSGRKSDLPMMRIAPLFETLSDLDNAPSVMETLFSLPTYLGIIAGGALYTSHHKYPRMPGRYKILTLTSYTAPSTSQANPPPPPDRQAGDHGRLLRLRQRRRTSCCLLGSVSLSGRSCQDRQATQHRVDLLPWQRGYCGQRRQPGRLQSGEPQLL